MAKPGFDLIPRFRPFRSVGANNLWTLLDTFRYTAVDGRIYEAPRGMLTELASIPVVAGWAFDKVDLRLPGAMHDAQYLISTITGAKRHDLDRLFAEMCGVMGGTEIQQGLLHAGLDVGGGASWDKCQKAGVTWADFDVAILTDSEIADYRARFNIADIQHVAECRPQQSA